MSIYGVAIISICLIAGNFCGNILGIVLGIDYSVGAVGISMIFLILVTNFSSLKDKISKDTASGLNFWQSMYIPVVVAMSSTQNVAKAISGGLVAIVIGLLSAFSCFYLLPVINKLFKNNDINSKVEVGKNENNI